MDLITAIALSHPSQLFPLAIVHLKRPKFDALPRLGVEPAITRPYLSHMKLVIHATNPIITIPTTTDSSLCGSSTHAADFVVEVAVEEEGPTLVVVVLVEAAGLEVAAAVAGREESFASVWIMMLDFCPFYS